MAAQTNVGTAIVCATGTTVITGPLVICGILGSAATSVAVSDGTTTFWSCASSRVFDQVDYRAGNEGITVVVTGAGTATIFTRTR